MSSFIVFACVAGWAALAMAMALAAGGGIASRSRRILLRFALFGVIFVAPLGDELLAWPQLRELCRGPGRFEYGPGQDAATAFGRTVYYRPRAQETLATLFPGVPVRLTFHDYVDAGSGDLVLRFRSVRPLDSLAALRDARGVAHPWLLHECWGAALSREPDERLLALKIIRNPRAARRSTP
jgi:hypothetical protein